MLHEALVKLDGDCVIVISSAGFSPSTLKGTKLRWITAPLPFSKVVAKNH